MKRDVYAKMALLLVAVIWGSSLIVVKSSTDTLPATYLLALRFTIGCLVLAGVFHKKLKLIDREYIKSGIFIGGSLFLAYITQTLGVMLEMPGKSTFLSSAYCVFVPFLAWVAVKERPDKFNVIASVLCVVGIMFSSVTSDFSISFGDTLSLSSSFFYALQIVAIAKFGKGKDSALITLMQFAMVAVCSWIATFAMENPFAVEWNVSAAGGVLYLALACTTLALLIQNTAQKYASPSSVSIILSLESVFGVVFGVIFFHEILTVRSVFGFSLIFIAILISETKLSFLFGKKETLTE